MARANVHMAVAGRSLPLAHRVAWLARRLLPDGLAVAIARSPFAALVRPALERNVASPVWAQVCAGPLAGARLLVDLRCEKYYWLGTHERSLMRLLEREVSAGATVWDIGAHIGYVALALGRFTGPAGRVYAFEPLPENLRRLRANLAANGAHHIEARGVALSDRRGVARMALSSSTLMASIVPGVEDADEVLVPTDTVDGLVAGGLRAPALLKIDVEGAEALVLRGGRETIAMHRPLLALEIHSAEAGRDAIAALPAPYRFYDAQRRRRVEAPLEPGRYVARPVIDGGSA